MSAAHPQRAAGLQLLAGAAIIGSNGLMVRMAAITMRPIRASGLDKKPRRNGPNSVQVRPSANKPASTGME